MKKCAIAIRTIIGVAFLLCLCLSSASVIQAESREFDYILPLADQSYYKTADLQDMPLQVLCYARNEIYARHNRIFYSQELTKYFELQPWYSGTIKPDDFDIKVLNEYEEANIALLEAREKALDKKGYVLDQPGYSFDEVDRYISSHILTKNNQEYIGIASGLEFDEMTSILSTDNFLLTLPEEWLDHYDVTNDTEDTLAFYCTLVHEKERYSGNLMLICRYVDYTPEEDFPNARYLGEREGYHYYVMYPTDVQFNPEDQEGMTLYQEMYEFMDEIFDSIHLR